MHEGSVIASLLLQAAQLVQAHNADAVEQIQLQVGPLAGVEPLLLREAFLRLREGTVAAEAELVIEETELTFRCRRCQLNFSSDDVRTRCPSCDRPADVIAGDAVMLESISVRSVKQSGLPL